MRVLREGGEGANPTKMALSNKIFGIAQQRNLKLTMWEDVYESIVWTKFGVLLREAQPPQNGPIKIKLLNFLT